MITVFNYKHFHMFVNLNNINYYSIIVMSYWRTWNQKTITMTEKELERSKAIHMANEKRLTQTRGAND